MMATSNRPLSPHLQVYRLPLTGIISICHRMTGVILAVGVVFFVGLLLAVAGGPDSFAPLQVLLDSLLARIVLFLWSYALFFHLCHGIRHLVWDAGHGFDKETMDKFALLELAASVGVTLLVWGGASVFGG
jgi:succinate dehydrogenase cytochrome b subunit